MKYISKCGLLALFLCVSGAVVAQTFPSKPLRLIVPFTAGGPADLYAREMSQGMSPRLGQSVLVENRGGAGGMLAMEALVKSPPDGYTLVLNPASVLVMAPFARASLPYDPRKDIALITTVAKNPEILITNTSVPAKNLRELVAYLKVNPGKLNYGSTGGGTITHLAVEMLKVEAKVNVVHVPYKGAAPVVTDLIAGQVQMAILGIPVVLPHIKSGRINALVITSDKRVASLPEVPTTIESGYPTVQTDYWYGLIAAAAVPGAIQTRLRAAAVTTLQSSAVQEQFARVGAEAFPSTEEEYRAFMIAEQAKWGAIIKAIGFKESD